MTAPRAVMLLVAILITVPLLIRGRGGDKRSSSTAFSVCSTAGTGYYRISGDVRYPGIYMLSANIMTINAINMAIPVRRITRMEPSGIESGILHSGDEIDILINFDGTGKIKQGAMSSIDRIIFGIPLDINAMTTSDFERLPGVGPALAQRIVEYRQNNGGKMRVGDLVSVEGIGEKRFMSLKKYF